VTCFPAFRAQHVFPRLTPLTNFSALVKGFQASSRGSVSWGAARKMPYTAEQNQLTERLKEA